ncbi:hypothetical protein [Haloferula sp. BvORR071]|uniref:hypothetical protein n=1 Tax=Haloferula sp. BvORR071 TaxID=1396141 RepID=UPI0005593D84|nr:hypothetical protein [Haloferula sp. BvORR071]
MLAGFWGFVVMIVASLWIALRWHLPIPWPRLWGEWMSGAIPERTSLLRPVVLLGAVVLGGLHYLALGVSPFEKRISMRAGERWGVVVTCVFLSVLPALQLRKWFRCQEAFEIWYGSKLSFEIRELNDRKDYRAMVVKMEEACSFMPWARAELGQWLEPYPITGGGCSYLYTTLMGWRDEPYQLNMPHMLGCYLGDFEKAPDDGTPPKSSEPLAREMVKSHVPIIRLTGLWWLNDRYTFFDEVDELAKNGDSSFKSWVEIRSWNPPKPGTAKR